jgi:hypothetical protein
MATMSSDQRGCEHPCTKIVKFMTRQSIGANVGISEGAYTDIDGYRHINIFVSFTQKKSDEAPVDLGVMFAFDANGKLAARCYVNLEPNVPNPQGTNFIDVSGTGTWHGSPYNISRYVARFPVLGPFVQVFVYNRAPVKRTVDVWAYLVA